MVFRKLFPNIWPRPTINYSSSLLPRPFYTTHFDYRGKHEHKIAGPLNDNPPPDTQQSADDTMVTVGENMGTMLFKPHLIVSKHCCLKSNTAILILAWNLIAAIGLKFASNPIMVTVTPLSAPIDSLILYQ